jgi:hypothetical protein
MYWLNQNGEPPQGEVKSWWEKSQHTKTLVTYRGFDELMMLVKDKFNLQEPHYLTQVLTPQGFASLGLWLILVY